jgi:hypothetical protein
MVKVLLKRRKHITINLPIVYPNNDDDEAPRERDIITPVDAFHRVKELCPNLTGLRLDCIDCVDPILTDPVLATIPVLFPGLVQLHICYLNDEYTNVGLAALAQLPKATAAIDATTDVATKIFEDMAVMGDVIVAVMEERKQMPESYSDLDDNSEVRAAVLKQLDDRFADEDYDELTSPDVLLSNAPRAPTLQPPKPISESVTVVDSVIITSSSHGNSA